MTYQRYTAASVRDVLARAEEILTSRLPATVEHRDGHSVRVTGGDGTAVVSAHKHGLDTVVNVETDQFRTSRLDGEVQYLLTMLPYQPGDSHRPGAVQPGGLGGRA